MDLKTRLESHPVATLKKEISKTNVKGYSKMKKGEVIELMLKNKDRFNHIKHANEPAPKNKIKVKKPKQEEHPAGIHIHINWKDGEKQLKKYKSNKDGEADFKKIRAERKQKRDYRSMKLMDGKKILDYSA